MKGRGNVKGSVFKVKVLPVILAVVVIGLCVFGVFQYYAKQQFAVSPVSALSLEEMIAQKTVEQAEQNSMKLKLSDYEWSQVLAYYLKDADFGQYTFVNVIYKEGKLYLELQNEKDQQMGYSAKVEFVPLEGALGIELKSVRLGTLNSMLLGFGTSAWNKLPKEYTFTIAIDNTFMYASDVQKLDDGVEVQLTYDSKKLAERISTYVEGIDSAKLALQKSRGNVEESVLAAIQNNSEEAANQQLFIDYVKQGEQALTDFSMVLNEENARQFLTDFKLLYAKRINVERIVNRSKSELEQSVQLYHHQFSRGILTYLFNNPGYTAAGEIIYVNGQEVTAATILNNQSISEKYSTEIVNDEQYIYAKYTVGDNVITKVVLKKVGEQ